MRWKLSDTLKSRLAAERGPGLLSRGRERVALVYPSPYRVGMSSLGYQWVASILADAGFSVERVFLPDDVEAWKAQRLPALSMETRTPLSDFPLIAVSLAYELELAGLIQVLELSGIPVLARDRVHSDPKVLVGGPLTFSNPLPAAPFADAMLLGEVEDVLVGVVERFFETGNLEHVDGVAGGYRWESQGEKLPAIAKASDALLPARSRILTEDTELSNMFLIEGERGCHRECTFCVMRRSTNGGMRLVTPEAILALIPDYAKKVGLVGAAISDHPRLIELLGTLVESGRQIGISSLRGDRVALKPDIPRLLRAGGYQTLTVASDAASQRLRRFLKKGTTEAHLIACAEAAKEHRYKQLKVYMMLGLPGETEEDLQELVECTRKLAQIHPVALGIAPFVPKFNTPLKDAAFAGIPTVEKQLEQLKKGVKGSRAEIRATSARWAWVEYRLAQGSPDTGLAVLQAVQEGGNFAAWKRALGPDPLRTS